MAQHNIQHCIFVFSGVQKQCIQQNKHNVTSIVTNLRPKTQGDKPKEKANIGWVLHGLEV